MNILNLLEAGTPSYDTTMDTAEAAQDRRALEEAIRAAGAGPALDHVLSTKRAIFRGIRGATNKLFAQNTWESTRIAQNTSNYVNLLTEVLPSWKSIGMPPRSKVVACTSSYNKAAQYGNVYIALPTDETISTYTRTHDFWDGFDGVNHIFNSEDGNGGIPAINEAFDQFIEKHLHAKPTTGAQMITLCNTIKADLDSGELKVEDMNPELRAIFESEPGEHDLLRILNNLLDPSHMVIVKGSKMIPSEGTGGWGEEIALAGKIVYVQDEVFQEYFQLWT